MELTSDKNVILYNKLLQSFGKSSPAGVAQINSIKVNRSVVDILQCKTDCYLYGDIKTIINATQGILCSGGDINSPAIKFTDSISGIYLNESFLAICAGNNVIFTALDSAFRLEKPITTLNSNLILNPATGIIDCMGNTIANANLSGGSLVGNANEVVIFNNSGVQSSEQYLSPTRGGTGRGSLTSGMFLIGAGTSNIDISKPAPAGTVVGTTDTQTLTNKTLTLPTIASIINSGTLTLPTSTDTLVGRATTDTLTNKTINVANMNACKYRLINSTNSLEFDTTLFTTDKLFILPNSATGSFFIMNAGSGQTISQTITFSSAPIISSISNTGTLTLPTSTDTLVGRGTTDTLTNKTLLSTSNIIDATLLRSTAISSTLPTDGQYLSYSAADSAWKPVAALQGGALSSQRWIIKDVKTVGTNGGNITANTWTTRVLNTLTGSSDTSITLSSNQITFAAGIYSVIVRSPGYRIGLHKIKLYNITTSTDIVYGTSTISNTAAEADSLSMINEIITFASSNVVEVRHICTQTSGTDGLGIATGISGTNEIYSTVIIEKLN